MRRRDLRKSVKRAGKLSYKIIDQRSGFEVYASEAVQDHRGRITAKNNFDEKHYTELQIHYPIDRGVPYTRVEPTDRFINETETTTSTRETWGNTHQIWGQWHRLWSDNS